MATRRVNDPNEKPARRGRPARTPEERERELVALAVDVAEDQMRKGTASAQVLTHYLKLGSTREHLERELLSENVQLTRMKREALEAQQRIEALYSEALNAMRAYSGQTEPDPDYDEHRAYDDDY